MSLSDKITSAGYFEAKDIRQAVLELKKWCDKQHVHEFGKKGEDCDKQCWGKTFPKKIDEIFGEKLL